MGHCLDHIRKWRKERNFCEHSDPYADEIDDWVSNVDKIVNVSGLDEDTIIKKFTTAANRPIHRCKDPDVKVKALNYVVACLKRGEKVTEGDLKKSIRAFYGDSGKCSVKQSQKLPNVKKKYEPIISDSSSQVS